MNAKRGDKMKKLLTILAVTAMTLTMAMSVFCFASDEVFHGGDVLYDEPVKAVLFSHKSHVEDMGFDCESCHDELFGMASLAAQANADFNMQGLYDGKYCGGCHNGEMAFASDTQCARCHVGVKGYNKIMGTSEQENTQH
jgi:c(7)-type cytochrome triheme protein